MIFQSFAFVSPKNSAHSNLFSRSKCWYWLSCCSLIGWWAFYSNKALNSWPVYSGKLQSAACGDVKSSCWLSSCQDVCLLTATVTTATSSRVRQCEHTTQTKVSVYRVHASDDHSIVLICWRESAPTFMCVSKHWYSVHRGPRLLQWSGEKEWTLFLVTSPQSFLGRTVGAFSTQPLVCLRVTVYVCVFTCQRWGFIHAR